MPLMPSWILIEGYQKQGYGASRSSQEESTKVMQLTEFWILATESLTPGWVYLQVDGQFKVAAKLWQGQMGQSAWIDLC